MITKWGVKKRKIGQSRRSISIYDNLGHPDELDGKMAMFIGKEEKSYSLTKGKKYKIIGYAISGKFNFDNDLNNYSKGKKEKNFELNQGEDYFIVIVNDMGHKKRYSHVMFKLINNREELSSKEIVCEIVNEIAEEIIE